MLNQTKTFHFTRRITVLVVCTAEVSPDILSGCTIKIFYFASGPILYGVVCATQIEINFELFSNIFRKSDTVYLYKNNIQYQTTNI